MMCQAGINAAQATLHFGPINIHKAVCASVRLKQMLAQKD